MEADELKIKSSFLKGIIAKLITKKLRKKFGDKIVNITINDIDVSLFNDKNGLLSVHVDISASAKRDIVSDIVGMF